MDTDRAPARCSSCGHVFPSIFPMPRGDNMIMLGNTQNCPRCGGFAHIVNVSSTLTPSGIQVAAMDRFSAETIGRYQELLSRIAKEDLGLEEIKEAIRAENPDLVEKIEARGGRLTRNGWITVLLFLVSSCTLSGSMNWNEFLDQVWHLVQRQDPNFHDLPDEVQARELGYSLEDPERDGEEKGRDDAGEEPAG